MAIVDGRVIESLQELGLSLYEARLYLGLLTGGPQNGNELSRTSGVPSSKVYAMLERLAGEGIVARDCAGATAWNTSAFPRPTCCTSSASVTKPLEHLEETLPTIGSRAPEPALLQVEGQDAVMDHARAVVRGAKDEIYLSIWQENVEPLLDDLDDAAARGVRIAGMFYGAGDGVPAAGWWQRHSYVDTVASRVGGRMLTMVADAEQALIAHMPEGAEASAVRTSSPSCAGSRGVSDPRPDAAEGEDDDGLCGVGSMAPRGRSSEAVDARAHRPPEPDRAGREPRARVGRARCLTVTLLG